MNILILYATNSGGTLAAAQTIADVLKLKGHEAQLMDVSQADATSMDAFPFVVLGSCTWDYGELEGELHEDFKLFTEKVGTKSYADKKFAVFALGDSSYTYFAKAADHLEEFIKKIGGTQLGQSVRIDGFYNNQEEHIKTLQLWASQLSQLI